jgi:hypothetical protein
VGWLLLAFFKSSPEGISFLAGFLLCPGLKEKSLIREQKKDCRKGSLS